MRIQISITSLLARSRNLVSFVGNFVGNFVETRANSTKFATKFPTKAAGLMGLGPALAALAVFAAISRSPAAAASPSNYTNHFNHAQAGTLSDEFLVLNGDFAVRKQDDQAWLELPGTPSDTYGLLFGPTFSPETDPGLRVRAQVHSLARGRRYPAFGVGAFGGGGFRLQVTPAKRQLELFYGETLLATQAFEWTDDTWTFLSLELTKRTGTWEVRGKAWPGDQAEPETWQITHSSQERLFPGRASIWGIPYSGRPIKFDNLAVDKLGAAP